MNEKEYNGWHNYETWAVKLWIDNEEPSYRYWRNETDQVWDSAILNVNSYTTRSEAARIILSENLKTQHEDHAPELDGIHSDLLGAALSEVDWFEIADAMLTDADLDGYEPRS